jgi:predicted nucleotidyltransferase
MDAIKIKLPEHHLVVVENFVKASQSDDRIVAAFLGGSYGRGTADEFSDLDLYLIIADDAFNHFIANKEVFLHLLGEPIFIEDFDIPGIVFYFFADGTEGELGIGTESDFSRIHSGPYTVLEDKKDILAGVEFSQDRPDMIQQTEKLRRLVYWFWHDLSHFITAMGRGQLWWAAGQLEALRRFCVNLMRMQNNFADLEVGDEPYFKIEKALSVDQLSALQTTFCPLEREAMLTSCFVIVRCYKELAVSLTHTHGIIYPDVLEQVVVQRLENL